MTGPMQLDNDEKKFLERVYRKIESDLENLEQDLLESPMAVMTEGVRVYSEDEDVPVTGLGRSKVEEDVLESLEEKGVVEVTERPDHVRDSDTGEGFAARVRRTVIKFDKDTLDELFTG